MSLDQDTEMKVSGQTRYALKIPEGKSCLVLAGVVFSVVLNVALVCTVAVIGHSKAGHLHSSCDTPECVETAAAVALSLNKSHPACSDFYEYGCGGYKLHHNIEEGWYTYTVWNELIDTHSKRMRTAIESADVSQKYGKEVAALFSSCMDMPALNETTDKPLLDILNKGGALQWPTLAGKNWNRKQFDMTKWIQTLHHIDIDTFFVFTKGPNPVNAGQVDFKLYPSSGGLNLDKWDYTSDQPWAQKRQEEYRKSMVDLISKLNVATNKTAIEEDVQTVFDFEVELAKNLPDRKFESIYTPKPMRLRGLYRDVVPITRFDWKMYMKGLFPESALPDPSAVVLVEDPDYFGNLSKILSHTSDRTIANFMSMRMVYQLAEHLPDHISGQVQSLKIYGYDSSPLYYQCASVVEKLMPWAALRTMLDKKLLADKSKAVTVFENVRNELLESLHAVSDKFSAEFATQLKNRVTHLHEKIGYPDWLKDKEAVNKYYAKMSAPLDPKQYFANVLQMSKFRKINVLLSTEEQYHDGEGWDMFFHDYFGAYYLHGNDIYLPSYYLFSPLYSHSMPDAFNYGGLGSIAGWYMVYALEDDYRQYRQENGTIIPLEPSAEDKASFKAIKGCYNYLANTTYLPPGEKEPISIRMTSNWGLEYQHNDIIAANLAYKAFKKNGKGSEYAPGLPPSVDQTFFAGQAQYYCAAKYSHHSYNHKLLNAIAVSRPEFSKAYGCQDEDLLYNSGDTVCYL